MEIKTLKAEDIFRKYTEQGAKIELVKQDSNLKKLVVNINYIDLSTTNDEILEFTIKSQIQDRFEQEFNIKSNMTITAADTIDMYISEHKDNIINLTCTFYAYIKNN